ncbi:MAG: glycoside hydrolase family 32 protein [Bacteroidales bacterium]|nr:glycoside hydrolase family 32 protein [Bacteroidales bacterium]
MKPIIYYLGAVALTLASCTKEADTIIEVVKEPEAGLQAQLQIVPSPEIATDYREQWRPQIHFTPRQNWINDPNGMVYADGTWHLYYQYNPSGQNWGNMSWGHATSPDLFHWTEQPVALLPDELGYIYSGSAVVDKNNSAGFGAGALVAIYTAHGVNEQQCIAYSTDGGMTFTKYEGNPVIKNTSHGDYRDPKVFWSDDYGCWYMIFALGGEHSAQIWKSDNLKEWKLCSTFSVGSYVGCNQGVWECTDMFTLDYKGEKKYVVTVNVSGGFPNGGGSGTMYFVGSFDGRRFIADRYSYPLWQELGLDNYASVTWSNTGDRRICIGWMNNQLYSGNYPCSPWRSSMTLPRELSLVEYEGIPLLRNVIAPEIECIAGEWRAASPALGIADAYQLEVPVSLSSDCVITLGNAAGDEYEVKVDATNRRLIIDRGGRTGSYSAREFPLTNVCGSLNTTADEVVLEFYVDQSSVEITTADGSLCMSTLVFPATIYDRLNIEGQNLSPKVRDLSRIW